MQYRINYKFALALKMANDLETIPEESVDKPCDGNMKKDLDEENINEATLHDVAAQLRRIGDELNEEYAIKKLPSLSALFGGRRLVSLLSAIKL